MKKKVLFALLSLACALCCVFGFVACNQYVDVTEVTLNKTELTLFVGEEETLTATVVPDNATNATVEWSSSKKSVATVEGGKITAVAEGRAKITATADGKSATCTVKVEIPESPLGRSFALADVKIYLAPHWTTPLKTDQVPTELRQLYTQVGKTIVFGDKADGRYYSVKGTFDFGEGALDTLTGDAVFTLSYASDGSVTIMNGYEYDDPKWLRPEGNYNLENGELELRWSFELEDWTTYDVVLKLKLGK